MECNWWPGGLWPGTHLLVNWSQTGHPFTDYLIIKNWLIYAKTIGDLSYQKVFKSEIEDDKLSASQKELISQRKIN